MNLVELLEHARQFAIERDWEQYHSPKNLSMALAGEAAELMEHFQWLTTSESEREALSAKTLSDIELEMADIFIYLLRLSERLDIDLTDATLKKIAINAEKYPVELAKGNAVKYNRRDDE
ncbi:nucleotide pyrophosphohydrolase [Halioglobus pacificus]|uniref:NTP pyrophosphohydrolase n=1 Tax=Parahalioglobus pacificus TaxID=930806 RepID=A0A918XFS9_9GAMM|nr:nucleotide pyrophosphohydrolase [Halioglobus pacificus]GHD30026.1 NTP pyrophosphohydrolase [Halioglobus pacificus]